MLNPLELSQLFVNISESSAVWPRLRPNWDMLIFFGIAPVLFILNYYKVHLFYRELNSLHRGLKIIHIFNIKVDHICVGTREIQSTTSRRSWRRWHWQCRPDIHGPHRMIVNKRQMSAKMVTKYLNYYNWRVRIVHKVILIQQHLPNTSCCVSCSRSWRHLPILEGIPIGILSKIRKLSIRTNGEFAQNTLPEVLWNVFRNYSVECITVLVILP